MADPRPSADALLERLKETERARLRIYIGAAPGVGKTYEMLRDAHALRDRGLDVVIGIVETYDRVETVGTAEGSRGHSAAAHRVPRCRRSKRWTWTRIIRRQPQGLHRRRAGALQRAWQP